MAVEHPVEVARRALVAAAVVEGPELAVVLLRMAESLPPRAAAPVAERDGVVVHVDFGAGQVAA